MNTPSILEAAIIETAAPVVTPSGRLATAQIIVTLARLGKQLELAITAYSHIPDGTPESIRESLKEIVKYSQAAILNAERLLEANR